MQTCELHDLIRASQARLAASGAENPGLDARLLIAEALGCSRADLIAQAARTLTPAESETVERLIARRIAREPVARILGAREFWGLPFRLNEATLEPRPDSETLIETALETVLETGGAPPQRLADFGTGTGCLLLALLYEWKTATGIGLDKAPRALEAARLNAEALELAPRAAFREGGWNETGLTSIGPDDGPFDVIVSNPPYIPHAEIATLEPEVRDHDPMLALDGGEDGLDPYRILIPRLPALLAPEGWVFFEGGQGQAQAIAKLFEANGYRNIDIRADLGGIERCVRARRPA